MHRKSRLISILLVLIMLLGSTTFSSFAASNPSIKVSTYQDNAQAKEVLRLINKERTKRGLKKLKLDKQLTKSAVTRAAEISIYIPATSPHKRPNGKLAKNINKRIIYECCAEGDSSPSSVVKGWMSSPPHRKGILLKNAKTVGIGCVTTDGVDTFWTLEFSNTKLKSKLTSSKKVHSNIKVTTLSKYLKKSYFSLRTASSVANYEEADEEDPEIIIGNSIKFYPYYSCDWNYQMCSRLAVSDFTWSSSNTSVASVDSKGAVTAKGKGNVKITATMKRSPGFKITQWITVIDQNEYDEYDKEYDDFWN